MDQDMPDAAAQRTAGEASSSGAAESSGAAAGKPIVVLVIGMPLLLCYAVVEP